jgi:uncharacterized protein (TIRG00374 family)
MCVPFALFIFQDYLQEGALKTGLIIGVIVFIIGIIIFITAIKYPEKMKMFITKFAKALQRKKTDGVPTIVKKINREVDNFHKSMTLFIKEKRSSFVKGLLLTAIMWSTGFMIPSMILLGLGLSPFFIESYAAQVLLLVIIMMPTTPGSTGITELGAGGLYIVLIGPSLIGVFVLLFRFITYHMNLIIGAIFQYRIFKSVVSFSMNVVKKQE